MISRKLCEQLDEAGFEKNSGAPIFIGDDYFPPSLPELVYATRDLDEYFQLSWMAGTKKWECYFGSWLNNPEKPNYNTEADTAEDAVALMWLKLHGKQIQPNVDVYTDTFKFKDGTVLTYHTRVMLGIHDKTYEELKTILEK